MSTTNIDEQKMQQINSSDTIKEFMEKCNNNFSNIFLHRSGPEGKQGVEGSQGVPTKPKVPIHVWREGVEYHSETISSNDGYVINDWTVDLTDIKYQEGHLIMLKNGHVYILEEDENSTLKPNYIMALQSYNQDDVIDGRSSYIHIAYTNSTDNYYGFITNEELKKQENVGNGEIKYKYMGLYSDYEEESSQFPETYTWVRIVGDTGEKGDKGDKGDTPTSTSVEVVGYSLDDLGLDSKYWKPSISDLGELKPGTPIYILNKYTWDDGTVTYGKTVTMAGTQGIKGETGRVLFYLGSFKDGTLTGQTVKGRLNQYRCDYYIDINDIAWMRTGTPDDETSLEGREGSIFGNSNGDYKNYWTQSDKVGFLQANAISADMINVETLAANKAFIDEMVANKAFIGEIVADTAFIEKIQSTEISANKITTGRISSTNNGVESYFDLDNGTFALGNALTYDGSGLSIKGVPDEDRIEEILTGLVGDIDIEIGGRNLLKNSKFTNLADGKTYDKSTYWIYYKDSTYIDQYTLTVEDGHLKLTSTVASWGEKTPRMGFYQTKENKSGQEYVLSFDAYADTPVYIKATSGYGSWDGENQRVQISKTKERYSIKMIGANGNATTGNISGYDIFFLRLDDNIQTSIYFDNFKLEEGTVATDWTPAPEDVDDAIAAVDSKAQSLEYLKKALANDTDIAGGIIATSTIQLRDWTGEYLDDGKTQKEYKVNAGISGIEDDNVLLWGGGTYGEACYAASANNDFHVEENKGGRQITSLLKKDGQGKIGVFHIEEDQVQVKTNDGNVVIDDIDGLSCKIKSQEHAAVLVTPKELKTFDELKELGETIDVTNEYKNVFVRPFTKTLEGGSKSGYITSPSVSYDIFVGAGGTITVTGEVYYTSENISISPTYAAEDISIGDQDTDGFYCTIKNSNGEIVDSGVVTNTGRKNIDFTAPIADTYTVILYAQIAYDYSYREEHDHGERPSITVTLDNTDTVFKIRRQYQIAEQQTMVAYKGIFSYQGDNAYFYYKDGVGLDCQIGNVRFSVNDKGILINGLQEGSSGLTKGMLYNDNGTLKIVQ